MFGPYRYCWLIVFALLGLTGCPSDKSEKTSKAPEDSADLKELLGTDSDDDGIRDDVAEYIDKHYGDDKDMRKALRNYAKLSQMAVEFADDKEKSREVAQQISLATSCLRLLNEDIEVGIKAREQVFDQQYNNYQRSKRYAKHDQNQSGTTFHIEKDFEKACGFDKGQGK